MSVTLAQLDPRVLCAESAAPESDENISLAYELLRSGGPPGGAAKTHLSSKEAFAKLWNIGATATPVELSVLASLRKSYLSASVQSEAPPSKAPSPAPWKPLTSFLTISLPPDADLPLFISEESAVRSQLVHAADSTVTSYAAYVPATHTGPPNSAALLSSLSTFGADLRVNSLEQDGEFDACAAASTAAATALFNNPAESTVSVSDTSPQLFARALRIRALTERRVYPRAATAMWNIVAQVGGGVQLPSSKETDAWTVAGAPVASVNASVESEDQSTGYTKSAVAALAMLAGFSTVSNKALDTLAALALERLQFIIRDTVTIMTISGGVPANVLAGNVKGYPSAPSGTAVSAVTPVASPSTSSPRAIPRPLPKRTRKVQRSTSALPWLTTAQSYFDKGACKMCRDPGGIILCDDMHHLAKTAPPKTTAVISLKDVFEQLFEQPKPVGHCSLQNMKLPCPAPPGIFLIQTPSGDRDASEVKTSTCASYKPVDCTALSLSARVMASVLQASRRVLKWPDPLALVLSYATQCVDFDSAASVTEMKRRTQLDIAEGVRTLALRTFVNHCQAPVGGSYFRRNDEVVFPLVPRVAQMGDPGFDLDDLDQYHLEERRKFEESHREQQVSRQQGQGNGARPNLMPNIAVGRAPVNPAPAPARSRPRRETGGQGTAKRSKRGGGDD